MAYEVELREAWHALMDVAERFGTDTLEGAELVDEPRREEGLAPLHDALVAERRLANPPAWFGSFLLHGFDHDDVDGDPPPAPWVSEDERGAVWLHQSDDHEELHSEEIGVPLLGALRWLTVYASLLPSYPTLEAERSHPRRVVARGMADNRRVHPAERENVWLEERHGRQLEASCLRSTHLQMSDEFGVMTPAHIDALKTERSRAWTGVVVGGLVTAAVSLVALRVFAFGWAGLCVAVSALGGAAVTGLLAMFAKTRVNQIEDELRRAPKYGLVSPPAGPYRSKAFDEDDDPKIDPPAG